MENEQLIVNGSIQVYGTLVLKNSKIYVNCTYDGENAIDVFAGGNLTLKGTLISAYNTSNPYLFKVRQGSSFYAGDSVVEYCGYELNRPVYDHSGLWISADGAKLVNCTFRYDYIGVVVYLCSNVELNSCSAYQSAVVNFAFLNSTSISLRNSIGINCGFEGCVAAINCSDIVVENCEFSGGKYYSIGFWLVSNGFVSNCTLCNGSSGLWITESDSITLRDTTVREATTGIELDESSGVLVQECSISDLRGGPVPSRAIETYRSSATVVACDLRDGYYGAYIDGSDGCLFYLNNFVNNTQHVYAQYSTVQWNSSQYGNYWDNYTGVDEDGDGIGDTPYYIDESNVDYKPLVGPWQCYYGDSELPTIVSVDWWPKSPYPDQAVTVAASVTDDCAVYRVILRWFDGTWHQVEMAYNETSGLYEAQIPPREWQTSVTFYVIVYDFSGNVVTSPLYGYTVVPEFSPAFLVPFLALALVYVRRKLEKR